MLTLGTGFVLGMPTETASAQKVSQKIPKRFRGTWRLKKSTWKVKHNSKLVIKSRSVKGKMISYKGKSLGVHTTKRTLSVFQARKGKQVSEGTLISLSHYQKKPALKVVFDTCEQYYTK